jgi:hypothetical protein
MIWVQKKDMKSSQITIYTSASVLIAILVWQFLFYNNPFLKDAIPDVQLIFVSVIFVYFFIRIWVSDILFDFLKILTRTLFRVWLLIFITFAISQSMERVGFVLSITFIFGYFEGLLDMNKWLTTAKPIKLPILENKMQNRRNYALTSIMLMSWIHILCAIVVKVFSGFVVALV